MKQKHFFIVGAQRSGTTYLYNLLDSHGEICMAKPCKPEPKYFLNRPDHGIERNKYLNLYFSHATSDNVVFGEKSTSYYESEVAARQIANFSSNAKIIFLLRNPVDRALSNFFFSVNNGLETRTIEEVFLIPNVPKPKLKNNYSTDPFDYYHRGEYHRFIKKYFQFFAPKQIKILIMEELLGNKDKINDVCSFLNVEQNTISNGIHDVVNASEKKEIDVAVREKLFSQYRKSILLLECMLGREITPWKNY